MNAVQDLATEKQLAYIRTLLAERPSYPYRDQLNGLSDAGRLTKERASAAINNLLSFPRESTVDITNSTPKTQAAIRATELPHQGLYTVVLESGERRTLRFTVAQEGFFAGKTLVQYLSGPDNESAYTAFAHVEGEYVKVWNRYSNAVELIEALRFLAEHKDEQAEAGHAYAIESGRCFRCNRTLTVPESIHRGLGPDCAAIVGG